MSKLKKQERIKQLKAEITRLDDKQSGLNDRINDLLLEIRILENELKELNNE